ncbi:MAG TPA: redoxin domain-containing protein [Candidatus Krumholzibacteria bacterium]|nr:redoxin domain-containing protein [Candidatus Krumholzibacteria bacterium]
MKWLVMICGLLVATVSPAETPEKALCVVCAANGETELEKVEATREYKGATYYFCSKKCAETFDANPAAYVLDETAAPRASWTTTAGEPIALESLRGQVVLIDFWATWCKPCVKTMPELDAVYRDYQKLGLAVVGVSVDQGDDREKKVKKFLEKKPVAYPIVIDTEEAASWEAFHVVALPTLYLIDRDGKIAERWTGVIDMKKVRESVDRAIGMQSR